MTFSFSLHQVNKSIIMTEYIVKTLTFDSTKTRPDVVICDPILTDIDDSVFVYSKVYETIFKTKKKNACNELKLLSIAKIQNGKRVIHRRIRSPWLKGLDADSIALSDQSKSLLFGEDDKKNLDKVNVTKGSKLAYYWFHPFHATRISFRLGFPALLLSIVSVLLSICC